MNPGTFQQPSRVNLFYAFRPPLPLCPVIENLRNTIRRAHGLRGKMILRECLHNTVASVYDPRRRVEDLLVRAHRAGAQLRHPAFRVRFEWTQSLDVHRDRYPLVLRGDLKPALDFRRALAERMSCEGLPVPRSYTPHITLLWADRAVEEYPIAPVEWEVTEFVLVLSGQSRHIILDHWQLG